MHDTLERIYNDLRGPDELLSREKFQAFLETTQGETDVDLEQDHYPLGDFLYVWVNDHPWDATRPIPREEKDLSKPLTNYFINSSHNTYCVGNQLISRSSPEFYEEVGPLGRWGWIYMINC